MKTISTMAALSELTGPVHLAIGVFDGVHLGHQAVIQSAVTAAQTTGGIAVVATFDPHPAEVLAPDKAPKRLTPLAHQVVLFSGLGVGATLAIPFDQEMANQSAEAFMEQLMQTCRLVSVHVGEDWAFGKGRQGNIDLLQSLGTRHGLHVCGIAPVLDNHARISSTAIRSLIGNGDLAGAERLLGRPYSLFGEVIHGDHLGTQLGFPTANIDLHAEALPPYGVYVVKIPSHNNNHGVANLGIRPTLNGDPALRFEVHLFDWSSDLYGQTMEVSLLHRLRPEQRFADLPALQAQITRDLADAHAWLR